MNSSSNISLSLLPLLEKFYRTPKISLNIINPIDPVLNPPTATTTISSTTMSTTTTTITVAAKLTSVLTATMRPQNHRNFFHQRRSFSALQYLEISILCLILLENVLIFLVALRRRSPKKVSFSSNVENHRQKSRRIIFPRKSILYHCLHRNWIRAYSFSNISLSIVYLTSLILKHFRPNLLEPSAINFFSLPITLFQQLIVNFGSFHLFIISISVFEYFTRHYRLSRKRYAFNIYNRQTFLVTKHTNVALILSASLALIFAYNFIFYSPKYPQTLKLLPLVTMNMILLPLIDILILILVIVCFRILLKRGEEKADENSPVDQDEQTHRNRLRMIVEKKTCNKCYTDFLRNNRSLLNENDPYSKFRSSILNDNLTRTSRPSFTRNVDVRKYSMITSEQFQYLPDVRGRMRSSYPCPSKQKYSRNKSILSTTEFGCPKEKFINTEVLIQTALIRFERKRSICKMSHILLLILLLKYVLLTFPDHLNQAFIYSREFYLLIVKSNSETSSYPQKVAQATSQHKKATISLVLNTFFLLAHFADSFLLTRLPLIIKKYFPCWFHFNSKLFTIQNDFYRHSHQKLMKNIEPEAEETLKTINPEEENEQHAIQDESQRKSSNFRRRSEFSIDRQGYRLSFQFNPNWLKQRPVVSEEQS